jgi:hypothetical protein
MDVLTQNVYTIVETLVQEKRIADAVCFAVQVRVEGFHSESISLQHGRMVEQNTELSETWCQWI